MAACPHSNAPAFAHAAMQTKTIDYTAHGKAMRGVLVWDDAVKTPRAGLLMIPDWRGINATNIAFAKTIAGRDYVIFMGDMYGKDLRPRSDEEARAAVKPLYGDRDEMRGRAVAAFDELKSLANSKAAPIDPSRLAAIGFCFGGSEWQFVVFGHTVHCFAEPSAHSPPGCVYNPKAAKRAFRLMHDWLDEAFAEKD